MLESSYDGGNGGGNGGAGKRCQTMTPDVSDLCRKFDSLVSDLRKNYAGSNGDREISGCYKETRSYAEAVAKMFSNDRILNSLTGGSVSKFYSAVDTCKLYVTGLFDKEKAQKIRKKIDKQIYTSLLEKFCDKYDGILNDLEPRRANAEKFYESLRQSHDAADLKSRQYSINARRFWRFRDDTLEILKSKRKERQDLVGLDPFDSNAENLTNSILALESKVRGANAYTRVCLSKAEAGEMLRQGYEQDVRTASQLADSCNYISDTLFRYIVQFRTLIKMHDAIGDADDFDGFSKSVKDLAHKTTELGKLYYDQLPRERELHEQTKPYEDLGKELNIAALENDRNSNQDIASRISRLREIHSQERTM